MCIVFLLLTLNIFYTFSSVSVVDFEQENVWWVDLIFYIRSFFIVNAWERRQVSWLGFPASFL